MKDFRVFICALVLASFVLNIQAQDKKAHNIDDSKVGLQGYSPVSYLDLNLAQRGSKDYKVIHQGISYYFTSAEQVRKFKTNPNQYLPQFGGFCAFGVYAGAKFRTDPHKFVVSNRKLYLFLYDVEVDAKQLWLDHKEAELLPKAQSNWKKLKTQI